jgi:hypothetical protein
MTIGRYRWFINYIDRQMIGVLKPTLQREFSSHLMKRGSSVIVGLATAAHQGLCCHRGSPPWK